LGATRLTFNAALPELGIPANDDLIGTLVDIYRTRTPRLTLPPESRAVLEGLRDKCTLGLLTDGFVPTQRLKVQALGIEHYLKAIVYTKELGQNVWKPSLRGCEKLLDMLPPPPEQAVYVADNGSKDFIAPNRLDLLRVQLRRPRGLYRQPSPLPDAAPRVRIEGMGDLPLVLASQATQPGITGQDQGR
jgi:putative hydrolase of the HAD superfamily